MRTIILMALSFLAGVYAYKYREGLRGLVKRLFRNGFNRKEA